MRPPELVPAGLYVDGVACRHAETPKYVVVVHKTVPVGLTERIRLVLKGAPRRAFTLGELAQSLEIVGPLWELNASLCKLVTRREVVKDERQGPTRMLKTYRWRLPSDR